MNKTKLIIGSLIILLIASISISFIFYRKAQTSTNSKPCEEKAQPANTVTYATFSSSKLDFTFEYPSTWTYKDISDISSSGTVDFAFYSTPNTIGAPVLTVNSPMDEQKDFCSGKMGMGSVTPYMQLNVFPTNNPETFVTYEQCGQELNMSGAIIYWQKGEKFLSNDNIKDFNKINTINFDLYGNSQEDKNIGLHVAQSIKIK